MKKVLIISLLLLGAGRSFSQTMENIGELMDKNQFAAAKLAMDKYIADPKNANNPQAWYFKGRIYNSLSRDSSVSKSDSYNYKLAALDAFKKTQTLDKQDIWLKSEEHRSFLDIYLGFFDMGAQQFNQKDFAASYNSFAKAQEVETYILANNWTFSEMALSKTDTSLIVNMAAAAIQNKDEANAAMNYRKITDAGITGKDYESAYLFLAAYYAEQKDNANLQAILTKAKAAYPQNNYWNEVEVASITASGDKTAMFAKYEELYKTDPNNYNNSYNYAVELYNSIYGKDVKNPDPAAKEKLTAVLTSAMVNEKGIDATSLMTNHLFNVAADYSTAAALIKSPKPDDVKKKKDLTAQANAKMDEAIPYAEKVLKYYSEQPKLTARQKVDYQIAAGYLADIYNAKANPKKAAEYDKIRESIKF